MNPHLSSLLVLAAETPVTGHVQGGWEYIWMAWGLSWAGMVLYAVSLILRRRGT